MINYAIIPFTYGNRFRNNILMKALTVNQFFRKFPDYESYLEHLFNSSPPDGVGKIMI